VRPISLRGPSPGDPSRRTGDEIGRSIDRSKISQAEEPLSWREWGSGCSCEAQSGGTCEQAGAK